MKNSFNEMEEANIRSFYNSPSDRKIRKGVNSSLGTMRFLGHIADVYVNRLVETMVEMASGPDDESKNNFKALPRESKSQRSEDSSKPSDPSKYPNL